MFTGQEGVMCFVEYILVAAPDEEAHCKRLRAGMPNGEERQLPTHLGYSKNPRKTTISLMKNGKW